MQPTSMLRTLRALSARTVAMASALVGKYRPLPSAMTVHGQADFARRSRFQRPDSATAMAAIRWRGMLCSRSAAATASMHARQGSPELSLAAANEAGEPARMATTTNPKTHLAI